MKDRSAHVTFRCEKCGLEAKVQTYAMRLDQAICKCGGRAPAIDIVVPFALKKAPGLNLYGK